MKMLSPREIEEACDIFHAFDTDEDGYINSYEVSKGFGRWFGNLRVSDGTGSVSYPYIQEGAVLINLALMKLICQPKLTI
jgi:hypothetical protein